MVLLKEYKWLLMLRLVDPVVSHLFTLRAMKMLKQPRSSVLEWKLMEDASELTSL